MKKLILGFFFSSFITFSITAYSQDEYRYSVDLGKVQNDAVTVELQTPKVKTSAVTFSFPKIIPGTYSISDYGKFISDVKAFDNAGKPLPVSKISTDKWKITRANVLSRITYKVEDIFDSEIKHGIYPMAATNIEEGKDFVIHTPGFFGFFDGYNRLPFTISIAKPANLYGSTSLTDTDDNSLKDVFKVANVDELYDSPIMYTVPDTTTITVGNCRVLVSVYSPGKNIQSKQIAEWMTDLLEAARQYLGGKLPADKYAFLFYFKDPKVKQSFTPGMGGALEHTTSSFYYLPDLPASQIKNTIVHVCSHEFFHIITPLTISSKEIKEFNYDEPVLSKHLWLYEGSTEYTSYHVQVKHGMQSKQEFLQTLSDKITSSRKQFNDTLPFTVLSKQAAGKYAKEYGNVYEKGALITACLDIYLLHLSNGNYGFRNLTYDLGVRFGKKRYFNDDELFGEIGDLTYPEIEEFLQKYVAGSSPIPYDYFFGLAGIQFTPKAETKVYSLGGIAPYPTDKGIITISPYSKLNDFGTKVGYKIGDELYAINGVNLTAANVMQAIETIKSTMKEGDNFEVKAGRKNAAGTIDTVILKTTVFKATQTELNKLAPMITATAKQKMVQQKWLTAAETNVTATPPADPKDVSSIDAIVKATYEVISGPAGPRNWDRFSSLFLPEAKMGATVTSPAGQEQFRSFTPNEYRKLNAPFFTQSAFYEEELKRNVSEFGNMATVASSYQFKFDPAGKVEQRGINYFTLAKAGGRWWIVNLSWQDEDEKNKLPAGFEK
ncbi:MAG: peptidase domain protein [Segetibacter sp.]|nr:peptidase domain protein [Segetibacter sp.]